MLFDIHVIDTDAQFHVWRTVSAVLSSAEREKKTHASQAHRASSSPFVPSVDGLKACEAHSAVNGAPV